MTEIKNDDDGTATSKRKKKSKSGDAGGFQTLGLSEEVYRGIRKMGFRTPTPVQRKSLPVILSGTDTVVMARTGSGKTAAFCIPLLERMLNSSRRRSVTTITSQSHQRESAYAVILSPTRELSLQTLRVVKALSHFITDPPIRCIGIHGGESMEKQFALLSSHPDVIAATPGRLAHHLAEIPDFHLRHCEIVVFDEADRLFEMGFSVQIRQICQSMPSGGGARQTMLFSATMPKVLVEFTKSGIMDVEPAVVRLDKDATVSDELRIGFICVRSREKDGTLLHLLRDVLTLVPPSVSNDGKQSIGLTLIFAATRHHVDYLTTLINNASLDGNNGSSSIATCIYGTMDQEARKQNLASFRSGKNPILVVTDVAARGIDVPLIDHVIHYSFPPSAKLFVHRSGRAARAGRIGYCWSLVDTEELPYMVDLFLFLGRKLSCGVHSKDDRQDTVGVESNDAENMTYDLVDMTPDMVHYGSVPESTITDEVENVRRIVESELTGSHDADVLQSLARVCDNAMKQYRRSRPDASREGIRRAKAILEGWKDGSGKRINSGRLPPHPVLRFVEMKRFHRIYGGKDMEEGNDVLGGDKEIKDIESKLKEMKKREQFLDAMSNFRPKETIFEAFATGSVKATGVVSHLDKGRTSDCNSQKKNDSSFAFSAMKNMRRQMKLIHDKGTSLVVAGSQTAQALNGEAEELEQIQIVNDKSEQKFNTRKVVDENNISLIKNKRRISKAERKRMKEKGIKPQVSGLENKTKLKRGNDYRDAAFYIDNESTNNSEEFQRSRRIEAAMQPSSSGASSALRLEENMLDIVGDENIDLVKKHRMMRWDKSKRKYMQTTLGSELSSDSKSKKLRLESGQLVKRDKVKLGELYEKWQKKTNKSIGRIGVFDDVTSDNDYSNEPPSRSKKNSNVRDISEIKTANQIRKQRETDKEMRLKNMKKSDRERLFKKERSSRNEERAEVSAKKKGWQGKKGFSGRYGASSKRK